MSLKQQLAKKTPSKPTFLLRFAKSCSDENWLWKKTNWLNYKQTLAISISAVGRVYGHCGLVLYER